MQNKKSDDFDGYTINLFFDEDGDYLAHLAEMPNVSAFGPTPAKALTELKTAWQLMKDCYQADGEPLPQPPAREGYAGPVNVQIDEELYRALADEAAKAQISLYALVRMKLMNNKSEEGTYHEQKST